MMSEIYECPVITDNEVEIDNSSELFCLEDNLDLTQISNLLDSTIAGELTADDLDGKEVFRNILERMETYKSNLSSSRTANLWFQCMEMVEILCKFIKEPKARARGPTKFWDMLDMKVFEIEARTSIM
eukprot:gene3239-1562_t